mmetsp:Transcript_30470/g.101302  ORF Transcript_30470/g.101302 Transcript_30470/m.101302 type:complete len:372 (-) Transcript_30470:84-1199(-)|eukprot:CAMPEP_0203869218 /NCGR_PEP_ID=MMETSP0359-20131031/17576_1 /ASSEMBLY_ACC=CAM_ASM_000338 /TAXON_ID=268821 /ORGANISM="Scrippsiella Hangoei, Strain SHTV-5" /LENGTH=371 /DNA_ID=CAMNT_0050787787 /DNA_START=78 /DNA_END=1193 /DNA_ORIENTATION=-
MADSGGTGGAAGPSAGELRQLRIEVDKLRERLDFMAPMLSLLNFTQDFFQRVECEASVQLMRLKNANVAGLQSGSEKEVVDSKMVDTAKWLHSMTDIVIGLQTTTADLKSSVRSVVSACTGVDSTPAGGGHLLRPGAHPPARAPSAGGGASSTSSPRVPTPREAGSGSVSVSGGGGARVQQQQLQQQSQQARPLPPRTTAPSVAPSGSAAIGGGGYSATGFSGFGASAGVAGGYSAYGPAGPPPTAAFSRLAEPSWLTGKVGGGMDSTLEFGGLSLGRGTWANAYRQATGSRREALRLLCNTGIVTERELADDLTVISEEHIEECISIAGEILQRWPPGSGPPPLREAKAFFEERLAAIYMKRAPSAFGPA